LARLLQLVSGIAAAWAGWFLVRQAGEDRYLRGYAPPLRSVADLRELKHRLTASIDYDQQFLDAPRPLLRAPASLTLRTGTGFCGENARVAILLLKQRGVRAHRLYLQGPRWGHVAVEQRWEDRWVLFDAHRDPGVLLPDEHVARIPTAELERFPNDYAERNPWVRAARLKLALRLPGAGLDGIRPPSVLVSVVERPFLMKALAALGVATTALVAAEVASHDRRG
jgi:hypothetical protein